MTLYSGAPLNEGRADLTSPETPRALDDDLDKDSREHLERAGSRLPRIHGKTVPLEAESIPHSNGLDITRAWAAVYVAARGNVVLAVGFDFKGRLKKAIDAMEGLRENPEGLTLGGRRLTEVIREPLSEALKGRSFEYGGDVHTFLAVNGRDAWELFWLRLPLRLRWGRALRLLTRRWGGHPRFGRRAVNVPPVLTSSWGCVTLIKPGSTLMVGQSRSVVAAAELLAVQAVATSALARAIEGRINYEMKLFSRRVAVSSEADAAELEKTARELAKIELDFSFGAEAYLDISLLFPKLHERVYYKALVDELALPQGVEAIRAMLERLTAAVAAEQQAQEARARQNLETRESTRGRVSIAIAAIGLPLASLFGFFGINTNDINTERSIFNSAYIGVYIVLVVLMAVVLVAWRYQPRPKHQGERSDDPSVRAVR